MPPTGFVGLEPEQVARLVRQLEGSAEEIERLASRADTALARVAGTVSIAWAEPEIAFFRSIAMAVGSMAADAERRLREFEEAERFERVFERAHLGLAGIAEGVSETLKEAERWIPGHWEAGEWIEGFWKVETETIRA